MATAEHKHGHRASGAAFDDDDLHASVEDADIEHLDDDGVPIPRETGPIPKAPPPNFSRAARASRYDESPMLPGASLPREGGLIAGKYRVEGVHARDSMVVTLKATHVELGQRVWVRYLLPRAARRPDALGRFMRSARGVARMRSEHTARVLDIGRIRSGIPFMVLDDMNGWDLDEVLRVRGPLPVHEAVEYVLQAAEAVAEAHTLGIVHGSLRPSNVLLARHQDESPLVKVVGFELSDVVDWTTPEDVADTGTAPTWFLSTLSYLAPEQIRSAEYVDERVDVWALGAILHALLSGGAPFRARTAAALLAAVAADEPRQISVVRGDVAPELDDLVSRCLAKNPADRPSSISEVARALMPFSAVDGQSVIDRISRMPTSSFRPPPLPVLPSRAIVPLMRPKVTIEARPRGPSARWLVPTAFVAFGASVIGATAVALAVTAGARGARDDATTALAVRTLPAAQAAPLTAPVLPPQAVSPVAPVTKADVAPPARAIEPPARRERADRVARSDQKPSQATEHEPSDGPRATTPKELFGDTR